MTVGLAVVKSEIGSKERERVGVRRKREKREIGNRERERVGVKENLIVVAITDTGRCILSLSLSD